MRAFWHRVGGSAVGSIDNGVTNEYKTLPGLQRYGAPEYSGQRYRLDVFLNWDNRYGEPDFSITIPEED